jgi:hypothetical protein
MQSQEQHKEKKATGHVVFPELGYPKGSIKKEVQNSGFGDEPSESEGNPGFRKRSMGNLAARNWDDLEKRYWDDLELDARNYDYLDDLG